MDKTVNAVQAFYDELAEREWSRFDRPPGNLEFATARHLIGRYFPTPGRACDIGAGPWRYSGFLAASGHEVTLVDLSPELLRIARAKLAGSLDRIAQFICASATDLSVLPDRQFNYALMMGPMYHLIERADRQRALAEFRRVLKDDGVGLITFFGSYGMLRLGIADMVNRFKNPAEIERFLGPTSFRAGELSGFTACHFSTPEAIEAELGGAGLEVVSYASAQGFAGGIRLDLDALFDKCPEAFEAVFAACVRHCEDRRFRDCGQHLHYVVRKS